MYIRTLLSPYPSTNQPLSTSSQHICLLPSCSSPLSSSSSPPRSPYPPTPSSQCSQYTSQSSGPYTLYTNGWGWSSGTGSQCSQIDSLSGSNLAWSTTWSWSGTPNQVKSYTNVETGFTKKQISTYTSMPTTWKWNYTGTDLRVNGTS
jgi:xyloglucan-specific endo-beta-1,4-glucanase